SFAGSAADLRGRLHAVLPAPGQVHRALGFRVHGLDDLAVVAEVLDGAGDLDVHHARPVANGSPSVEGARGLVDVVAGPDALPGTEDLTGPGEVEGMDVAGMAVHRDRAARLEPHQLGPAVRGEAQRPERLARAGRDPRHAVGVERPGRLECHVAHSFLPVSAIRPRYGRIGLRPRSNHIRIPWAKWAGGTGAKALFRTVRCLCSSQRPPYPGEGAPRLPRRGGPDPVRGGCAARSPQLQQRGLARLGPRAGRAG